jgi:hypothetical protein
MSVIAQTPPQQTLTIGGPRQQAAARPILTPAAPPRPVEDISARFSAAPAVAREQLARAVGALDQALAAGREAAGILVEGADLLKTAAKSANGADLAHQTARAIFQRFDQMVAEGGPLLSGDVLSAQLDPDSAPVEIVGIDARRGGPIVRIDLESDLTTMARDAQASLARLDSGVAQLSGVAPKLAAHGSFLDRLETGLRANVAPELSAEAARLTALNVSQSLAGADSAILRAAPQTILALFRD